MRFDRSKALSVAVAAASLLLAQGWAAAQNAPVPISAQPEEGPVWVTNQGARLVIGQESFTRQNPVPSRTVLGAAQGVAFAGNRLFVADGNRLGATPVSNRVLIYDHVDGFVPQPEALLPQSSRCPACVGSPDIVLGQPDFDSTGSSDLPDLPGLNNPSGVHSDGLRLAVADTNNNRVLLWHAVPVVSGVEPDIVLGQEDFSGSMPQTAPSGMRGPQGVWIEMGRLFVADTQNSRILIWNSMPTSNGQPPDLVLGQPDLNTRHEADLAVGVYEPDDQHMLDPVGVSVADGRLFVADLGFNRVMIFNSVPTQNFAAADVVVGQPDFASSTPNNVEALCEQIGPLDDDGSRSENETPPTNIPLVVPLPPRREEIDPDEPRYPRRCAATLNFPRFALAADGKLFIADAGNDRILVYHEVPAEHGASADLVIGQPNFVQLTESEGPGSVRSPSSMAYDGQNLYVADPFSRRILLFTPGEDWIDLNGIRNAAAIRIHSRGHLEFDQELPVDVSDTELDESRLPPVLPGGEEIKITLDGVELFYTTTEGESAEDVRNKVVDLINADDTLPVTAHAALGVGRHATGTIKFGGEARAGDHVSLDINGRKYEYVVPEGDIPERFVDRLNFLVDNADDPEVLVERKVDDIETLEIVHRDVGPVGNSLPFSITISPSDTPTTAEVSAETLTQGKVTYRANLTAKREGPQGNWTQVELRNSGTELQATTSGSRLTGGSDARDLPPGTIASIFGRGLAERSQSALDLTDKAFSALGGGGLPNELGGVQVLANGRLAPILMVSEQQINAQIPWELEGTGYSIYIRRVMPDGSVKVSAARANQSVRAAPGLFTLPSSLGSADARPALAVHATGIAEGTVAITVPERPRDDDPNNDDTENRQLTQEGADGRIIVGDREYYYRSPGDETAEQIRDHFIALINAGDGDPAVTAEAGTVGFFSARADFDFLGEPKAGDTVTITVRDRSYSYTLTEQDVANDEQARRIVRNILVRSINAGVGDPEVTARVLEVVGAERMQIVARSLGSDGNEIPYGFEVSAGAGIEVETNRENGFLEDGNTPPVVVLKARQPGKSGNEIVYAAQGTDIPDDDPNTPDVNERTEAENLLTLSARGTHLCCGNEPFSLITPDNPLVPGEEIIVFGTGLGLTDNQEALATGLPTPMGTVASVPLVAEDFVSSQFGGRTAQVEFVGLMEGTVGVYQVNLRTNTDLPDNPTTPLWIAQVLFISNSVTLPVKNLVPRPPVDF